MRRLVLFAFLSHLRYASSFSSLHPVQAGARPLLFPVLRKTPKMSQVNLDSGENVVSSKTSLRFDVVLTHMTADFDTLAAAVGLAKLWQLQDPSTPVYVCMPRGANPTVAKFLALHHKQLPLLPLALLEQRVSGGSSSGLQAGSKKRRRAEGKRQKQSRGPSLPERRANSTSNSTSEDGVNENLVRATLLWAMDQILDASRTPGSQDEQATSLTHGSAPQVKTGDGRSLSPLRKVGLVDAQRRDRVGPAGHLLDEAEYITVVDHHIESDCDFRTDEYIVDKVGAVTTLVVERLQKESCLDSLTEMECTLMALGIHADTGSLSFDSATYRDARALMHLMERGASQTAIAEFSHSPRTQLQRDAFMHAMNGLRRVPCGGNATLGVVLLSSAGDTPGLARVTEDLLELSAADAVLLGATTPMRKRSSPALVLCGRARANEEARNIDLGAVLHLVGGGGHPRAAAGTTKLPSVKHEEDPEAAIKAAAEDIMDMLLRSIEAQLVKDGDSAESKETAAAQEAKATNDAEIRVPPTGEPLRGILFDMVRSTWRVTDVEERLSPAKEEPSNQVLINIGQDGTLTDSDSVHFEAYKTTLARLAPDLPEITREFYDEEMSGQSNEIIVPKVLPNLSAEEQKQIWIQKEEEYRRLTSDSMQRFHGLDAFLEWCDSNAVKTIVVTNAPREDAMHTLAMLGLFGRFAKEVVIGMECAKAKPSPDPYIEGLRKLGLSASECIAFEDSPSGAKSATSANLRTVAVLSSRTEEEMVTGHGCAMGVRRFDDPRLLECLSEQLPKST